VEVQRLALRSWASAGLSVRSFNHPSEIAALAKLYDVDFVPVKNTSIKTFGRHYVPINALLNWARDQDAPVLLVNADLELRLAPWEMQRLRWLSDRGLAYFIRHNHNGTAAPAAREHYGIDAFLLHGRDGALFPESFLSMGQPAWDYWLPHVFAAHGLPVCCVDFPVAFHAKHPRRWTTATWSRCVKELSRVAGISRAGDDYDSCLALSRGVRAGIEARGRRLSRNPFAIREWVERTFARPEAKVFLELGAHQGTDTAWLAQVPGATVHAFEPDPRNTQPPRPNVVVHELAVSDRDGVAPFVLSRGGWGREWTYSSSLKLPKNHFRRYPVTFGETIEVHTTTLDSFCAREGVGDVALIWADIQGAEREMIRGAHDVLERTRYLYTEWSDDELYEGQATLREILEMLPDFRVLEMWPDEVLLENRVLACAS
jgi:FkbM family methyltransferase